MAHHGKLACAWRSFERLERRDMMSVGGPQEAPPFCPPDTFDVGNSQWSAVVASPVATRDDTFIVAEDGTGVILSRRTELKFNEQGEVLTAGGGRVLGYQTLDGHLMDETAGPLTLPAGFAWRNKPTGRIRFEGQLSVPGNAPASSNVISSARLIDLAHGQAPASLQTLLIDVARESHSLESHASNEPLFKVGNLEFHGHVGGSKLRSSSFVIFEQTTIHDLLGFLEKSLGIHKPSGDNTTPTEAPTPGATIADGHIQIVSNPGKSNAVKIRLESVRQTVDQAETIIRLDFGEITESRGASADSDATIFDRRGVPFHVRVSVVEGQHDGQSSYRWYLRAWHPLNEFPVVRSGEIRFDEDGRHAQTTNASIEISYGTSTLESMRIHLDFHNLTVLGSSDLSIATSFQDGAPLGTPTSLFVTTTGAVVLRYSNGLSNRVGQLAIATINDWAQILPNGPGHFRPISDAAFRFEPPTDQPFLDSNSASVFDVFFSSFGGADSRADLNGDGRIDLKDFMLAKQAFL